MSLRPVLSQALGIGQRQQHQVLGLELPQAAVDGFVLAKLRAAVGAAGFRHQYRRHRMPTVALEQRRGAVIAGDDEHRGFVALLRAEPGPWAVDRSTRASAARVVGAAFRRAWEEEVALAPPAGTLDVEHSGRLSGDCAVVAWAERVEFASWLAPRVELAAAGVSSSPFGPQTMQPAPASFMRVLLREEGGPTCSFEPVVPMVLPSLLLALSPALKRVASLAAAGATVPEIARATDRSPETVKESLGKIYQRLGVSSRAELVSLARRVLL